MKLFRHPLSVIFFVMLICVPCFGESIYLGLQPGLSTHDDVDKALGQPVNKISETISEYNPQTGTGKIYVEYRVGSPVVEQIEVFFLKPISRAALIQALKLPEQADKQGTNEEGKLMEYFRGESKFLVMTHVRGEISSGISSLGYYSRELFERAVGKSDNIGPGVPLAPQLGVSSNPQSAPVPASTGSNKLAFVLVGIAILFIGLIAAVRLARRSRPMK
jgi:hypothetical protein